MELVQTIDTRTGFRRFIPTRVLALWHVLLGRPTIYGVSLRTVEFPPGATDVYVSHCVFGDVGYTQVKLG